jgi:hypothetical protein
MLDLEAARAGIDRDIDELLAEGVFGVVVLTVIFGLPLASLVAVVARRWLAVVSLLIALSQLGAWVAYYATDWTGPQSGPAMLWLFVLMTLCGWVILCMAIYRPWTPPSTRRSVAEGP